MTQEEQRDIADRRRKMAFEAYMRQPSDETIDACLAACVACILAGCRSMQSLDRLLENARMAKARVPRVYQW